MGLTLHGLPAVLSYFGGMAARVNTEVERQMGQIVLIVAGRAQFHIRGSRATNPPEMLGVRTGRLRQSIAGRVVREGRDIVGLVGPQRVKYAAIHELGGEILNAFGRGVAVDMPRRPYLAPALEESRELIQKRLGDAVGAALSTG